MIKKPIITRSVKKIAVWYAAIMILFYLLFNAFTLFELNYILVDDLDLRLTHELEHILNTIIIETDSIKILNSKEFEEPDLNEITDNPFFLQIYDLNGYLYYQSNNIKKYYEIDAGFPNKFDPYYFEDTKVGDDLLRIAYKELKNPYRETIGYIQIATIQSRFNEVLVSLFLINLITLPLFLFFIIWVSLFLAKKSYYPISKIIELANSISATNLSKRLDYDAEPGDELYKLRTTLNSLFGRLENQIDEISHFTDNASHQLMTPLTAIRTELDYILKKEHPIEEYKETCNILKAQTDRMIVMVRSMLIMSKECHECADNKNVFQLSNLINNEIKNIYSQLNISYDIDDNLYLRGKADYFSIVIQNLISNAEKYSSNGSPITVSAKNKNGNLVFSVADNGIGIKDEEKKKIFQRFYRVDEDEVNNVSGYGLGLSLVKSVVESMGGTIEISNNQPTGTIFIINLGLLKLS